MALTAAYEKAMKEMSEYLSSHNYGKDDYDTYSKDPEWQRLNKALMDAIANK